VLFLIQCGREICDAPILLLNKRSAAVRQPGDLCCPGGRVNERLDGLLGTLLRFPGFPLARSCGWKKRGFEDASHQRSLAMHWACCLRESWEEMGLWPCGVEFLGTLPLYKLRLFDRRILPMVGWVRGAKRFRPNWEVERIIPVGLDDFLRPERYGVYFIHAGKEELGTWADGASPFPCFVHEDSLGKEILWGATYHIVLSFLERVYDFRPPPLDHRPAIHGSLSSDYMTGQRSG
jgi:hypothetical protein